MKKIALFLIVAICLSFASCNNGSASGSATPHTVSFDSCGGTSVASDKLATLDSAPVTTRDNYVFCGWYLDKELNNPVVYPLSVKNDMTLYARWSKSADSRIFDNASVQFDVDDDYNYKAEYFVTPDTLDIRGLAAAGYYIKIHVTYNVYYEKVYNVPFDIGYLGAPDHDVAIVDDYDEGTKLVDLPTDTEPQAESFTAVVSAASLLDTQLRLQLMTYNVQNVVYFTDISVTYTVQKHA